MPHPALSTPEILLEIFSHLEGDGEALGSVILVSRTWYQYGIPALWMDGTCRELARLPNKRRQFYASEVRELCFTWDEAKYAPCLKGLVFSKLKNVSIRRAFTRYYTTYTLPILDLYQYIQFPLREFAFCDDDLEPAMLDHLKTACPHLRSILLNQVDKAMTPETLLDFLKTFPYLESLTLLNMSETPINDYILLHLASCAFLKTLTLGGPIIGGKINEILSTIPIPFRSIQSLDISVHPLAVPQVTQMMTSLTKLSLTLRGEGIVFSNTFRNSQN